MSGPIKLKRKRMPLAEKIKLGHFLSLNELSQARGMSTKKLSAFVQDRESGFPLFDGKVRLCDFDAWYRRLISFQISEGEDSAPSLQSGVSPQRLAVSKPRVQRQNYDLELALQSFR